MQTNFKLTVKRARWIDREDTIEADDGTSLLMHCNRTGRLAFWKFVSDDGSVWELDFGPGGQGPETWKCEDGRSRDGDPESNAVQGCFTV